MTTRAAAPFIQIAAAVRSLVSTGAPDVLEAAGGDTGALDGNLLHVIL